MAPGTTFQLMTADVRDGTMLVMVGGGQPCGSPPAGTVTDVVAVQPAASFTTMLYAPAASPLNVAPDTNVSPPFIEYWYGAWPPVALTVMEPLAQVGQLVAVAVAAAVTPLTTRTFLDVLYVHAPS